MALTTQLPALEKRREEPRPLIVHKRTDMAQRVVITLPKPGEKAPTLNKGGSSLAGCKSNPVKI